MRISWFPFLCLLAALTGIGMMVWPKPTVKGGASNRGQVTATAQPAALMAVASTATQAQPTTTATPSATIDPNIRVTAEAAELEAKVLALQAERLSQAQTQVGIDATRQEVESRAAQMTATAVFGAGFATSTVEAYRTQTAPTAEAAIAKSRLEGTLGTIAVYGGCAIGMLLAFAFLVAVLKWSERRTDAQTAQDAPHGENRENFRTGANNQNVTVPNWAAGVSVESIVNAARITPEQLYQVALGVRDNVEITHRNWTPEPVCMSEGQFNRLQYALIARGLAKWSNPSNHQAGFEITTRGDAFFETIANTPPPAQDAPETPSRAQNDTIDGYRPLPGVGEVE